MQEAEYYNKIFQTMEHLGDVRKTDLTPHIVDETGRYHPCEGERRTPFELLSLQDLVLHHLHQRLRVTSDLAPGLVTVNYCLQPFLIENLIIPERLKDLLRDLYTRCPRHRGAYYTKNRDLREMKIYIKRGSELADYIAQNNLIPHNQREKYLYKVTLWRALREQYTRAQIIQIFPLLRSGLGRRKNFQ